MARTLGNNQVKLDNGQTIQAQQGAWYDGQQFWDNSLSTPGQINVKSNQQGAGQDVSAEVIKATNPAQGLAPGTNEAFLAKKRQEPGGQPTPTGLPAQSGFSGSSSGQDVSGAGSIPAPAPAIDLQGQFKSLFESSGIGLKEEELAGKNRAFTEAKAELGDNPFLSEASRVGREAKLEKLFNERTANLRDEIATKRADVETQLNLQLKQFDINSEVARQGLDKLNTLLSLGALSGASGEDIANLTRSTGISSDMIRSAIKASTAKDANTQVVTATDNAGRVTVTVIDKDTGAIVNKSDLGAIGKARVATADDNKINEQEVKLGLVEDVRSGQGVRDVFGIYSGLLDSDEILRIYNSNSPHGPAKESAQELQQLGVNTEAFGIF